MKCEPAGLARLKQETAKLKVDPTPKKTATHFAVSDPRSTSSIERLYKARRPYSAPAYGVPMNVEQQLVARMVN